VHGVVPRHAFQATWPAQDQPSSLLSALVGRRGERYDGAQLSEYNSGYGRVQMDTDKNQALFLSV
jgi:hypothetical protein